MQDNSDFQARFKRYRLDRLWTLERMSNITGLAISAVWNLENGKTTPTDLTLAKIRRALPDFDREEVTA